MGGRTRYGQHHERMELIERFIIQFQRVYGYAPTNRHMALMFGVHEVTMCLWMAELQDLGRIRRGKTRRALIEIDSKKYKIMQ